MSMTDGTIPDLSSFSFKIGNRLRNRLSAFMFNASSTVLERLQELDTFPGITQSRAGREKTHSQRREHLRNRPHTNDIYVENKHSCQKRVFNAFRQKHGQYIWVNYQTCQELIYYCFYYYYLLITFFSVNQVNRVYIKYFVLLFTN